MYAQWVIDCISSACLTISTIFNYKVVSTCREVFEYIRVAIIGRPNVGKSTIFNKIIGDRLSIVEDVAGVTRDRIYSKAEWLNYSFFMIDTGGIELEDTPFQKQIRAQAELAIDEADVIIFLTNGRDGVTSDDEEVAKLLYKTRKRL